MSWSQNPGKSAGSGFWHRKVVDDWSFRVSVVHIIKQWYILPRHASGRLLWQRQTEPFRLVIMEAAMKDSRLYNRFSENIVCHNTPVEHFERLEADGSLCQLGYRSSKSHSPSSPSLARVGVQARPRAKSLWIFRQRGNSPAAPLYLHMRPAKRHHIKSTPETTHKDSQVTTIVAMGKDTSVKCGVLLTAITSVFPPKVVLC